MVAPSHIAYERRFILGGNIDTLSRTSTNALSKVIISVIPLE